MTTNHGDLGDLAEFLLARIAEDEATAKAADAGRWIHQDKAVTFEFWSAKDGDYDWNAMLRADTRANGEHIAHQSPGRVIAKCAADRRIVALARADHGGDAFNRAAWEQVLLEMAVPYADHPDYREEWRP